MAITTHPHPYLKVNKTRNQTNIWSGLVAISILYSNVSNLEGLQKAYSTEYT